MELTVADEGLHPHGSEENWQESWAFSFRDAETGLGAHMRVGVQINRGASNLWCAVFKDRDKVYRLNLEGVPFHPLAETAHGIGCGPQRLFHDGERLRVQLDQPECQVDLVLEDIKTSVEKFEDGGKMAADVYRNHFNMHCRVRGVVVLDGVRLEVRNGLGWRDHSWGPRRWDNLLAHRSFHGSFGEDLNFHMLTLLTSDGNLVRRGHLVRNGVATTVGDFTIRVEILEDGVTPTRAACHMILPGGETMTVSCHVQKGVFAQVETLQAFFGVGECYAEGRQPGYCNFEMNNNPRHGVGDIKLAIGNTLANGFCSVKAPAWMYEPLPEG